MAVTIVKLLKNGVAVIPRTTSDAVNINKQLWNRADWEYDSDSKGNKRLLLTKVLDKIPELIDEKIQQIPKTTVVSASNIDLAKNLDQQAPSAKAMWEVIDSAVGWSINKIDSI